MRSNLAVTVLAMFFLVVPLQAHRTPQGLTTLTHNPNTNTIEVVHQLHAHDVEAVLSKILKSANVTLDSLEGRARFALYIEEHFQIVKKDSREPVPLVLLGAEQEDDYIFVYQEYKEALPDSISIRNDILREVVPEQINIVNILINSQQQTLTFSQKDKWKDFY